VNLPLFKINFPDLSHEMVYSLITIATFDVLPTDDLFAATLAPPESEQTDQKFIDVGYGSNLMIVNLGTMFLTLVIMLTIPCCLLMTRPCKNKSQWLTKKHTSLIAALHGNMFIRYLLEGSLDIAICCTLNLYKDLSDGGFQWDSTFNIVNNVAQFVLGGGVMVFPIFVVVFYCINFARWKDEDFDEKYGAIFEGLRKNSRASLLYPIIFVVRRLLLVFVATITQDYFFIQLISLVFVCTGQVFYLVTWRPFEEPLLLKLDIFNEVTTVFLVDILTFFSNGNNFPIGVVVDIAFLVCLFSNLVVHLFFLVKDTVVSSKRKCKRSKCCKKTKKAPLNMKPVLA